MSPLVRLRRLGYRVAFNGLLVVRPFLRRAGGGVKCVITDRDRVLLVRHTYGAGHWDLPGGGHKRREAPPDTARREMREELGLDIADWRALGVIRAWTEHQTQVVHIYGAEVSPPSTITLAPAELWTAGWFPLDRLPSPTGPFVARALAGAGLIAPAEVAAG